MLKGSTKIELTDIHTGTTETVEDENMFTNGLKYVVNALSQFYEPLQHVQNVDKSSLFPIVENLLGGVMLFSSPLQEDADNIYPPAKGNKMIGCANMSMNDIPALTERGSFNSNESGANPDGSYTFVWEFNTTQANGTISSLALVPDCAGINGINLKNINNSHGLQLERLGKNTSTKVVSSQNIIASQIYTVTTSEKWIRCLEKQQKENEETIGISLGGPSWNINFYADQVLKDIDYDMGKIHCAHIEDVDGNYVLFDYDIDFSTMSIGLYEYRYEMTGISNVRSMILTSVNQGFFGSCKPFNTHNTIKVLKTDSNNYVVMGVISSVAPNNTETGQSGSSTHSVMCVNMLDKTITQQFTKTYPCYLENISTGMNVSYFPNESKIMFVCHKQSYVEASWCPEYYLAFVDIKDFNSISYVCGLKNNLSTGSNNVKALFDGYYVNPFPNNSYLLKMDDEITIEPIISRGPLSENVVYNQFTLAYLRDKVIVGELESAGSYSYPYIRFREAMLGTVLMTINNLETSVEKTADKTMKITYTVREVEE